MLRALSPSMIMAGYLPTGMSCVSPARMPVKCPRPATPPSAASGVLESGAQLLCTLGGSMRSPFPGMDPYLEEPGGWKGVHGRLIVVLGGLLNRDLGPDFIADGDTRVYLVSPGEQH